jgi:hypothetical protein
MSTDDWIWGNKRGGGGAPLVDQRGELVTNLRRVFKGDVEVGYSISIQYCVLIDSFIAVRLLKPQLFLKSTSVYFTSRWITPHHRKSGGTAGGVGVEAIPTGLGPAMTTIAIATKRLIRRIDDGLCGVRIHQWIVVVAVGVVAVTRGVVEVTLHRACQQTHHPSAIRPCEKCNPAWIRRNENSD